MERRDKVGETIVMIIIVALIACPFVLNWYWHFYYRDADARIQSLLPAPPDCYVPPGVAVDGSATAKVQAWNDLNGNGVRSPDELPLQGAVVMMTREDYPYSAKEIPPIAWAQVTDKEGQASLYEFRPGCACRCWQGRAVAAWGSSGFEVITPTLVPLTTDDQVVSFGLRQVGP